VAVMATMALRSVRFRPSSSRTVRSQVKIPLADRSLLRLCLASLVAAMTPAVGHAGAGEVESGAIHSERLGRAIPYKAYVPGTARRSQREGGEATRYPVLYLLHGHSDNEATWLGRGHVGATLDRLTASGDMPPTIVVMPGAGNSWYVDDARGADSGYGAVFSAMMGDFIAGIDRRLPTLACRGGRVIGGLSMGGYGAVLAGVTHPERFRAVISLSGSLFAPERGEFDQRLGVYRRIFGGVFGEPPGYDRFREWNVFARLATVSRETRLPDFFLSVGDDDFRSILAGTVRFHMTLRARDVASELRVIDAGHDWSNWRGEIARALAWLGPRLADGCGEQRDARGAEAGGCRAGPC
jgi:enterochelin esterase-like enzyme